VGQGEWKIFQDFLQNPSDVNGTASALEAAAAKAYHK
jgi:alpha-glucoside transport system substrate-binding protein